MTFPRHNHGYNSASYYEAEREVVRADPCDSYSSEYRASEYSGYPAGHRHHHNGGLVDKVSEVVYESNPGYGRHHHGGASEYVERREEVVYENGDPCRRY